MTEDQLKAIEERAAKATEGPWSYETCYGVATIVSKLDPGIAHAVEYLAPENADFIAAARTDVPALCAEVRRLRVELAKLEVAP